MREAIPRPARFTRCYGCGQENALGLKLDFAREGDAVVATFVPAPDHGGYGRVLHGGVTSTLIDEAFGWTIFGLLGRLGMTTELHVTYSAPLFCGEAATIRGSIERHDEREAIVRAIVTDPRGRVAAEGRGTLRFVSLRAVERLGGFTADAP